MADEYYEAETGCSISEAELEKMYSGKYLGAADIGDRKIKAKILSVFKEPMRQQDGSSRDKAVLGLEGLDKTLPLNATNRLILREGLDPNPEKWIGRTIGLKTVPRTMNGKPTRGIEVVIIGGGMFKAAAPSGLKPTPPAPKPPPKIAEEATPWPEEAGDPGFGSNDDDFRNAAE